MQYAFDSSTLVTWILQEQHWQAIDRLLGRSDAEPMLPGPALAEVIHVARRKGNASPPAQIRLMLMAQGITIVHPDDDLVRAAELLEASDANPGPEHPVTRRRATLSLADAMILAICEQHGWTVVTRDQHWEWFAQQGHTGAKVSTI